MVKLRATQPNVPLAVVGEQPRDAAAGPRLEQLDPQLRAIDRVGVLPTLQSVPGTPIPNSPYCEAPSTSATRRCEALRVVRVAACSVHWVRDRSSYNVARRFQCPLAFSGSSRATIELQLPNPAIGEITSLKGSWRPHARRPSRPSRRFNDPYFGAIRFEPVLRTWLARRRHPRYTTDVAPRESNADHWITAPSPCWVMDACIRGLSVKAITHMMVI
jgi:hypothetical protein